PSLSILDFIMGSAIYVCLIVWMLCNSRRTMAVIPWSEYCGVTATGISNQENKPCDASLLVE
ncbi:hypothetical protein, partial [Lonsdalea populi]|uniref:hypothetical protein n=1 Tax=Lonsdalea populi TaxID=1172565 RepID=UPI001C656818